MKIYKQNRNSKRGAALVEYGLIVAGVALVAAAAVSVFGSKTGGLIAGAARVLPGAQAEDNALIQVGHLIQTTDGSAGAPIGVNGASLDNELHQNLGLGNGELDVDPNDQ